MATFILNNNLGEHRPLFWTILTLNVDLHSERSCRWTLTFLLNDNLAEYPPSFLLKWSRIGLQGWCTAVAERDRQSIKAHKFAHVLIMVYIVYRQYHRVTYIIHYSTILNDTLTERQPPFWTILSLNDDLPCERYFLWTILSLHVDIHTPKVQVNLSRHPYFWCAKRTGRG